MIAVARVLRVKFELGLFEQPYVDPAEAERAAGHENHRTLAREAARASIVLLKNERQTLPLTKGISSIAVIGSTPSKAAWADTAVRDSRRCRFSMRSGRERGSSTRRAPDE